MRSRSAARSAGFRLSPSALFSTATDTGKSLTDSALFFNAVLAVGAGVQHERGAHPGKFTIAIRAQSRGVEFEQAPQMAREHPAERGRGGGGVAMGAAGWLRDDFVGDSQLQQIGRRQAQGIGGGGDIFRGGL